MSDSVWLRGVRSRDPKLGYADRSTSLTAAKPKVFKKTAKNSLSEAVRLIHEKTKRNEKHLTALYVCMGFSVARKINERREIVDRYSPFWKMKDDRTVEIKPLAIELMSDKERPTTFMADIKLLGVEYNEMSKEFREFCDRSTQVMAQWLGTDDNIFDFLNALVSREGIIKLKRTDVTGSPLRFSMMSPIIGKWIVPAQFEKQRSVNFNRTQAMFATLKWVARAATTTFGVVTGATDADKQAEYAVSLIEKTSKVIGLVGEEAASNPVWNNMRAFLVRSQDVSKIMSQITDELLRQQRPTEVEIRHQKQQIRERLDRRENEEERKELRSSTESMGITLVNQILDVSCNISLAFYGIYKLYNEITGDTQLSSKGQVYENDTFDMDATGDRELVAQFLDIVSTKIQGSAFKALFSKFGNITKIIKDKVKTLSPEWLDKVLSAFTAFEQDLRDGIQDVELALSAYRLRVSAENELYSAAKGVNRIKFGKDLSKKITVSKLPTYEDVTDELDYALLAKDL